MSDSGDDALDKARELDDQWEHYMGADKPQSPPAGEELDGILDKLATEIHNLNPGDVGSMDRVLAPISQAKAALHAYILAQVLELIGPDVPMLPTALKGQVEAGNRVRAQLRQAAIARFGGEKP